MSEKELTVQELVKIEERERDYFKIILDIFQNEDNIEFLRAHLKKINNRTNIIPNYLPVNKIKNPWQELMRFILFRHAITHRWKPAFFAASADTCFETNDCFLNFDVKTGNIVWNYNKEMWDEIFNLDQRKKMLLLSYVHVETTKHSF